MPLSDVDHNSEEQGVQVITCSQQENCYKSYSAVIRRWANVLQYSKNTVSYLSRQNLNSEISVIVDSVWRAVLGSAVPRDVKSDYSCNVPTGYIIAKKRFVQ